MYRQPGFWNGLPSIKYNTHDVNIIDIGLWTCPRAHLPFSKCPRGSTRADMFVDINLADCNTPKHFRHIFLWARADYNPKLITTWWTVCTKSMALTAYSNDCVLWQIRQNPTPRHSPEPMYSHVSAARYPSMPIVGNHSNINRQPI